MSEEPLESFKGKISNNKIILDKESERELETRGFGEKEGKHLILQDYEILFLIYNKKLQVQSGRRRINMDSMVELYLRKDCEIWTKFLIYRDLRSRGYIVKEGFGFGVDFRVYERGTFGSKPAKYVVFVINEGSNTTAKELEDAVTKITRMGKEPIIAVLERRGEVIYYRISKMRFQWS